MALGIGMAIGMAARTRSTKFIERELVFTRSLLVGGGRARSCWPRCRPSRSRPSSTVWLGLFCGLAWVTGYTLLQENVDDEFRGRTFASLTVLSRLALFAVAHVLPDPLAAYGSTPFHVRARQGSTSRARAWRSGRRGSLVLAAGLNTRRLLQRHRLSRPSRWRSCRS